MDPNDREGFKVHSFAGDPWKECRDHVRQAARLPEPPQKQQKAKNGGGKPWTLLGDYIYRDAEREAISQGPKSNWMTRVKGDLCSLTGAAMAGLREAPGPKLPYRLPELIAAPTTAMVYFCEGEKDADNLAKIGFVATTMSEGSSAEWDPELTPFFKVGTS